MSRTEKRHFANSTIGIVSQTGAEQTDRRTGITVELHWRDTEQAPYCAEVYDTEDQGIYVEVGLEWGGMGNSNELTGYDGVFEIPGEVLHML